MAHVDAALGGWTSAFTRAAVTESNATLQNLYPSIGQSIEQWYRNRLTAENLKSLLEAQGVDYEFSAAEGEHVLRKIWRSIVDDSRPRFNLEQYFFWRKQGRITPEELREVLRQHGYTHRTEIELFEGHYEELPYEIALDLWYRGLITDGRLWASILAMGLHVDDANKLWTGLRRPISAADGLALYQRGIIDFPQLSSVLDKAGLTNDPERAHLIELAKDRITIEQALTLWNRGKWSEGGVDFLLNWHGLQRPEDREGIKELAKQIPGASDLITFAVREVWTPEVVERFGYDREFPAEFAHWMKKQGYGWGEEVRLADGRILPAVEWAKAYWRAHWHLISPEQSFNMLHRLRGNPDDPESWRVPGVRPFTLADVNLVLKTADYPPAVRDQLAAISYRPLRLVDIRAGHRYLGKDKIWLVDNYMDRGSSQRDAEFLADLEIQKETERIRNKQRARGIKLADQKAQAILRGYFLGWIPQDEAMRQLRGLGWREIDASNALQTEYYRLANETAQEGLRQIKADWMGGRTNEFEARDRMNRLGIKEPWVSNYITRWRHTRGEARVAMTSSKLLGWYKAGLLTREQVFLRLTNLGWSNVDSLLGIAEIEQQVLAAQAKLAESEAKRQAAAAKELEEASYGLTGTLRKVQAELRRITPIAVLKKWVKDDRISPDSFRRRMQAMGYPANVIELHLKDVLPEERNGESDEFTEDTFGSANGEQKT